MVDTGAKLKPGTLSKLLVGVGTLDLTDLPPGAILKADEVEVAMRRGHGLLPAEVEAVRARRAAQGPNERSRLERLARAHANERELPQRPVHPLVKRLDRAERRELARQRGTAFRPEYAPGTRIHRVRG